MSSIIGLYFDGELMEDGIVPMPSIHNTEEEALEVAVEQLNANFVAGQATAYEVSSQAILFYVIKDDAESRATPEGGSLEEAKRLVREDDDG